MNTQRRTFRGRGGPTDRRLPKHNARRRRAPGAHKPAFNKYQQEDGANHNTNTTEGEAVEYEEDHSCNSSHHENEFWNDMNDEGSVDDSSADSREESNLEPTAPLPQGPQNAQEAEESGRLDNVPITEETRNPCLKEVQHLKKRVRNIRETMKLSNSIHNPLIYQNNVLNAVSNCVNEWRSIATHYPLAPDNPAELERDQCYMTSDVQKSAALEVFEMIQQAIQCGPLTGAKPGYFKRCGAEVAKVAKTFLEQVIPHSPALRLCMGFTAKQLEAMESWQRNAHKAVLENKPPSRTAMIHQAGQGTGKKAKKKQGKR